MPARLRLLLQSRLFQGRATVLYPAVDDALAEIDRLPGRHLYFVDDHLFGNPRCAASLFDGGLRSLFVGFETVNSANLSEQAKYQNVGRDYDAAVRRLHQLGLMVNASFVFGMDHDGPDVFERTVQWAISQGIETATFHILTPDPGTALYTRIDAQGRLLHRNWDLYDTRHVVFRPARLEPAALEAGYWRAYRDFYRWGSILRGASTKESLRSGLRHVAYAGGWKKFEPLWDVAIRTGQVLRLLPLLETVLAGYGEQPPRAAVPVSGLRLAQLNRMPSQPAIQSQPVCSRK